jgi:macrolide transport system ATP-binding/permease protein
MDAGAIVVQRSHPIPDMEKLAGAMLTGINPNLATVKFQTFPQQIDDRFTEERLIARLTSPFGGLALLLAAIGLYGVAAYTVLRRTAQIGIRKALGAERIRVVGKVIRAAMLQTLLGLALGAPVAMLCVRYVKSQLYPITSVPPDVLIGAVGMVAAAAALAGIIPAKRAASIDPAQALRVE